MRVVVVVVVVRGRGRDGGSRSGVTGVGRGCAEAARARRGDLVGVDLGSEELRRSVGA